jgi:hypothetical protein
MSLESGSGSQWWSLSCKPISPDPKTPDLPDQVSCPEGVQVGSKCGTCTYFVPSLSKLSLILYLSKLSLILYPDCQNLFCTCQSCHLFCTQTVKTYFVPVKAVTYFVPSLSKLILYLSKLSLILYPACQSCHSLMPRGGTWMLQLLTSVHTHVDTQCINVFINLTLQQPCFSKSFGRDSNCKLFHSHTYTHTLVLTAAAGSSCFGGA